MKTQVFLPFDSSTVANYKLWAQGIGNALSAMGWTKTADTAQVVWANVTVPPTLAPVINGWNPAVAWVSGTTSYVGVGGGSTGSPTIVTNGGVTYACVLSTTALSLTQALQNTAGSFPGTLTNVTAYNGTSTTYTFSGTPFTVNQFQNQQVVITGLVNGVNNGTFMCLSNTTTQLLLVNPAGITASGQTGTATISASVLSFIGTITGGAANGLNGFTMTTSGFVNGANNGTFVVTSSSSTAFAVTQTGVNETHAGLAAWATVPSIDTIHWAQENFEIWQMTDPSSSTNPFFLRITYTASSGTPRGAQIYISAGTSTTGNGFVAGVTFTKAGAEILLPQSTAQAGQGSSVFECDFCVSVSGGSLSVMLWRDSVAVNSNIPNVFVFDRAHDNFGNDLDAYVVCLTAASSNTSTLEQILYKPGTGGIKIPNSSSPLTFWSIPNFQTTNTLSNGNNAPVLPVFPVGLGYLASPCLGALILKPLDCVEGSLVPVFMYGASHNFLIGKGNYTNVDSGTTSPVGIGIRFE